MIREPRQTCTLCGSSVVVVPDGRGFPPRIAAGKLKKICQGKGCRSDPKVHGRTDRRPATFRAVGSPPGVHGLPITSHDRDLDTVDAVVAVRSGGESTILVMSPGGSGLHYLRSA